MNGYLARYARHGLRITLLAGVAQVAALSEPIAAHHLEGTVHGYLSIRDDAGHVLAAGDAIQIVRGDRVTAHTVFHFKDGSLDDETAVFTQRGSFHLISDHHVQTGPFFSHPVDMLIETTKGQVTVRSPEKDGAGGEAKVTHMTLPPDLYTGSMIVTIAKNLPPDTIDAKVSLLVATPKPRLVKLAFSSRGQENFSVAGSERKAEHFVVKFEIQGIAGVIAPIIGKQPPDLEVWVQGGEVPVFVKEQGQLSEGGSTVSIQQAAPAWPTEPSTASTK